SSWKTWSRGRSPQLGQTIQSSRRFFMPHADATGVPGGMLLALIPSRLFQNGPAVRLSVEKNL
ncbi:MAG TPA: hypothetical protein VF179_11415, partial [Thermoanaerobaculia bacterium]|nr:hypothetical protein [Thermoanaerobaculia bacterium]